MKLRMAVLSASGLLLVACASTAEQSSYYTSQSEKAYVQTRLEADEAYMERVEILARRRGVGVHWVNPPTKIIAKGD